MAAQWTTRLAFLCLAAPPISALLPSVPSFFTLSDNGGDDRVKSFISSFGGGGGNANPGPTTFGTFPAPGAPSLSTGSPSIYPSLDLRGKVAFIAGVADSSGFGWAIAKSLNLAGAKIVIGCWAPLMNRFENLISTGALDADRKFENGARSPSGSDMLEVAEIFPLDVAFDSPADITPDIRENRRFSKFLAAGKSFTIEDVSAAVVKKYGKVDFLVHAIANGPEVAKPLLQTSRSGYLSAIAASSYSMVSLVQHFAPHMAPGGAVVSLTYIASERVIPGYGGGMSSAKAALESDTRTLAFEVGQKYSLRVNTISAGPLKSRAATAISKGGEKPFIEKAIDYSRANACLAKDLAAAEVADTALFLLSPMARAVTGVTLYVDHGLFAVGMAQDAKSLS